MNETTFEIQSYHTQKEETSEGDDSEEEETRNSKQWESTNMTLTSGGQFFFLKQKVQDFILEPKNYKTDALKSFLICKSLGLGTNF